MVPYQLGAKMASCFCASRKMCLIRGENLFSNCFVVSVYTVKLNTTLLDLNKNGGNFFNSLFIFILH